MNKIEVRCRCGKLLFDGEVLKHITIIRVAPDGGAEAKCKFCKGWARVPFVMQ